MPLWTIALLSGVTGFASFFSGRQPQVTPEMVDGLRHHEIVNCEKAVRDLGYEKVPLRTMLETALAWQVEHQTSWRSPGTAGGVSSARSFASG